MKSTMEILTKLQENSQKNHDEIFTRLYRYLLRPDIYFIAYQHLYSNKGAGTKGVNDDTADRFSEQYVTAIIEALRTGSYEPKPVRRTYIQKKNGKLRPLGLPVFADKLVQEAIRMILEAIYEPIFSIYSHGFRPGRSCHTALAMIKHEFTGAKWFIEGDIKGCFDNIDHSTLIGVLNRKIKDARFPNLIRMFLKAGYKQKFISQIMTSKSPMRSCDDIDEQALSYAEIKALCAGDPRIREKMDLDVQVAKLKFLRGDFQNQKYRLEDKLLKTFPEEIQKQKTRIAALQQDSQIAATHPQDKENFCGMTIKGMVYDDKKAAGERLLLARQEMPNADMMLLGTYRGFELNIRFDSFKNEHQAVLRAELSYPVSLGDDARGNITRLDNAIDNFADRIADAENALQNLEQQKRAAEVEVAKPFAQEEELAEKSARLAELNALLNIDRDRSSSQDAPEETEKTEAPATRPSVLAALGEKTNQPEPVKPFRSYYDKDGDAR